MSDGPNFDIAGVWRDFLSQWETAGNSLGGQAMGTPEFSKAMNQAGNLSAATQHFFAEISAKYLSSLNLPSRADITALGDRMQSIEGRLDEVLSLLRDSTGLDPAGAAPSIRPTRNRKPPEAANQAVVHPDQRT
ncbi:hypothetical protein [Afipia sp. GAS231]|uniref:hypothetical protein n=1 Tax=Afipia sp. GAS231 TaxID=1882747 RepID=UPI00087B3B1A|nr:hypothetical protein [Afipia sp. GAS231]SDO68559.1 hypothetical protein SAMN05444050_4743 [Afipia sp. GAS231]